MEAWNKGKRVGQKKVFKLEDIWRIRIRLELEERLFELALFNLAIDCKLRSCDLRNLKVQDVSRSGYVMPRTIVKQQKTQQTLSQWIIKNALAPTDFLFPSSRREGQPISHYYTTIVNRWVTDIGLDKTQYGTHSLRRTKASLIYAKTKNLRAIQLLLGHAKLESTIEYLGVEIEDALRISENCET
ncbi:integrase [Photobacterium profundum]|uniref:Site-specific recombinase, phage integrase family protein n=1 Tax=Photobacterium profundum 3TCK TaxID=314280 RepID=Q1Z6D3_9GAMM|nr:tyrosine-type recombinase/integrase [Photobacterium profundum]EAS44214.1 site-specific recombinase, phage integrase family protein [Photobacterium profundum 3TCK]PSV62057.1 integrase [Photobacterium profundum]